MPFTITRKGYITCTDVVTGELISLHTDADEAVQRAGNRPPGSESEIRVVKRVKVNKPAEAPPVFTPPPIDAAPPAAPSPAPTPPAPPPAPTHVRPLVASLQHGAADRAAASPARRAALAKFDWVLWGIYRKSPTLCATLEASIAACRAVKPAGIHSNYVIAYELAGQTARIASITRSGTTVTVTTRGSLAPNMQVGRSAYIASSGVAAYNGTWVITAIDQSVAGAHRWTFTATGGATSAADDNPSAGGMYVCTLSTGHDALVKLQAENWFLRKQGTAGAQTAWTTAYAAVDMNLTDWLPVDSNGDRWVDWKADDDDAEIFSQVAGLDYVFVDNYMDPRDDVINDGAFPGQRQKRDWKRTGVMQNRTDADILAAHRAGLARYASNHRTLSTGRVKSPNVKVIGNTDSSFANGAGFDDAIEAGFIEGATGKDYSPATLAALLARHDAIAARLLAPAHMVWSSNGSSVTDYQAMRFGLCCALMRPTAFYSFSAAVHDNVTWYDEFEAQIGAVVGTPPVAAWSNGVYRLEFANAWVYVNPEATQRTVTIGAGLRRLGLQDMPAGTASMQAPTHNTGAAQSTSLTLAARDGVILMKA